MNKNFLILVMLSKKSTYKFFSSSGDEEKLLLTLCSNKKLKKSASLSLWLAFPFLSLANSLTAQEAHQTAIEQVNRAASSSEKKDNAEPINEKNNNSKAGLSREKVYSSAVSFANWVDRLFGEQSELESARYDFLRLVNVVGWRDDKGAEFQPKIKAKVFLPKTHKKLSLLFSDDELENIDQFSNQTNDELFEDDDLSVSAALNYRTDQYDKSRFDWRIGLDSSLDSFALLKHTYDIYQDNKNYLVNYNYIFWREQEGQGVNVKLEYDRILSEKVLFRWKYSILHADRSLGSEWYNNFSVVESLENNSWVSYDFGMRGATDFSYDVEAYRLAIRYRVQLTEKWFFMEIEPEATWLRTPESIKREFVPGIIFRFEFQFED
ncbi:hypothetical protein FLL45_07055 [Aliikangiella marina]|uniref:DUF481 domain-containing protein n=1 Tax=Aliikangiella marina TaxID=1712262 RepID=A0A545TBW4_9GAMM|nr:hypothetical protein [Aliikangiella marina]TQV74713.1 hypothetical protein FLL45_07055 [Aliikangiella marina]